MSQATREKLEHNIDNYQQMKSVANTYVDKRECSIQECACHILVGQCLCKTFPRVIFANSNLPEEIIPNKKITRGLNRHFEKNCD